ncbi:butyrophilin subfamily 2 member A2-like isoform X2 [Acanthochromis polyacanthus]|uniref:butyrophilin subfamily 2 member A2-like isoform X2 n=1 Tax=Acanthochromis polyacanthus TaxID=80966 RepID=UPI0022342EEC|nr:butyrophilin subfamily 2 member A2-like isoform X2 [Acanthochromis polyacanthus]
MKPIHLLCLLMITGMVSCDNNGFIRVVARVGEDVVLLCSLSPEVDIIQALFDWMKGRQEVFLYDGGASRSGDPQFQGRVSHFPDKLKNGDASIVIRNITLSDSGNYSCYFPRLQQQRFFIELLVGIVAKPRAMILDNTKDQALLQCEVRGAFPKPKISWIDSNGTILPATEKLEDSDGLHYPPALTFQTNVTKPGVFRCRVTQEELNHTTEAQISTIICSDKNDKTVTGSTGVHVGVVLLLVVVIFSSVVAGIYWRCWRPNRETIRAIFSRKAKRPVMESQDNHDSSLHPSPLLETREPTEEAEPDEALMTPLQKSTTSPNNHCQPFFQ